MRAFVITEVGYARDARVLYDEKEQVISETCLRR